MNRTPPTNCRCTWTRKATTGWARIAPKAGCDVHGPARFPEEHDGTTRARIVLDAAKRSGMTVQDLYDAATALIDAHADPQTTLAVRIGWRNNLLSIQADPRGR